VKLRGSILEAVENLPAAPVRKVRKPRLKSVTKAVSTLQDSALDRIPDKIGLICMKDKSNRNNIDVIVGKSSTAAEGVWICFLCGFAYGDENDPLFNENWLLCSLCTSKYHEKCAVEDGVLDDDRRFT